MRFVRFIGVICFCMSTGNITYWTVINTSHIPGMGIVFGVIGLVLYIFAEVES